MRHRAVWQLRAAFALLSAACTAEPGDFARETDAAPRAVTQELIDLAAFEEMAAGDDPFDPLVPGHVACPTPAFVVEEDLAGARMLEVRTDVCNYLTLAQPTQVPIRKGDKLKLWLWHNTLAAEESAQAYVAIQIDSKVVWSVDVPIPSAADSYEPEWRSSGAVPSGSRVLFHIHNHGANAWRLGGLMVETSE